jgi:betaine-aldehyde dehydrogenase
MPAHLTHFWEGRWQPAEGAETFEAINPSNGELLARLPVARATEVDAAVRDNPVGAMVLDVEVAVAQLEYFAGLVFEIRGETIPIENGALDYARCKP